MKMDVEGRLGGATVLRAAAAFLALSCLAASGLRAQDEAIWRYTSEEEIKFYRVTPPGDLMVGTKDGVVALDPETGEPRWSRHDILRAHDGFIGPINPGPWPGAAFDPIPFSPYGVVRTNDGILMLDLTTGETVWDSTAVEMDKVRGHFVIPQHDLVLVYGEAREGDETLVAVDALTGEPRWRRGDLFERSSPQQLHVNALRSLTGHQPPLVDSDSTFILDISKDGPMRIHSRTGELLWRSDIDRDPPRLLEGYAPMLLRDGTLFVPYERTCWRGDSCREDRMLALNTADGSVLWNHKDKFPSRVAQMELTPHGLVVRGRTPPPEDENIHQFDSTGQLRMLSPGYDFFIDLLDPLTGAPKWGQEYLDLTLNTRFIADEDGIFLAVHNGLLALDYADGSPLLLAELEFEDSDPPSKLEVVGTNFLVSSGHDFNSVNRAGVVQYRSHFEGPGLSGIQNVLLFIFLAAPGGELTCAPGVCGPDGEIYFGPAFAAAGSGSDRLAARAEAVNYTYTVTKVPDASGREGFSLLRLDKRTGEEVGRVWMVERRPDFVLDELSRIVFAREDDRKIAAYRFPRR
jgi:hypothetical protein